LVNVLPGRTVITIDHGEAFGEYIHPKISIKIYGHPQRTRIECLIKVPFFIVDATEKDKYNLEEKWIKTKIRSLKIEGKI